MSSSTDQPSPAVAGSVIARLRDFETSLLANTIGYLDPTPPHRWYLGGDVRSVTPSIAPTVGLAVPCRLDSSTPGQTPDAEPFWQQLEQMRAMNVPTVWVVQCVGSRPDHECVIGEGMAKILAACGCTGIVTNGGARDIRGLLTVPFAAYCRGPVIHHGPLRFSHPGEPVQVGGITIRGGDLVHADSEGVITIPRGCWENLAGAAVRMRAAEAEVHHQFRRLDLSVQRKRALVAEVFDKYGFGAAAAPAGETGGTVEPT